MHGKIRIEHNESVLFCWWVCAYTMLTHLYSRIYLSQQLKGGFVLHNQLVIMVKIFFWVLYFWNRLIIIQQIFFCYYNLAFLVTTSNQTLSLTKNFGAISSRAGIPKNAPCTNGVISQVLSSTELNNYLYSANNTYVILQLLICSISNSWKSL